MATARGIGGYVAPASGFLSGLERGIGLYDKLVEEPRARAERERLAAEDRQFQMWQRSRQISAANRQDEELERRREDEAASLEVSADEAEAAAQKQALDAKLKLISDQAKSLVNFYGTEIPDSEKARLSKEFSSWLDERQSFDKRLQSVAQKRADNARKAAERLRSAKTPAEANPADVASVAEVTGIPVSDMVRQREGEPSKVEQSLAQVAQAMESGDFSQIPPAATYLLRKELAKVIGKKGADGTPITGVEIVGFVPHKDNPEYVSPVLSVQTAGSPRPYIAPVTQRRSSDPDDPAIFIRIDELKKRADQLSELVSLVNQPGIAERLRSAAAPADSASRLDPAMLFGAIPGIPAEAMKQEAATKRTETTAGSREKVAATQASARVAAANISASARGGAAQRAGGGGGRPAQRKYLTSKELDHLIRGEASKIGLVYDEASRRWMQRDEKGNAIPASMDSMEKLEAIRRRVVGAAVQGKVGAPIRNLPSSLSEVERGELYKADDGSLVEYLGDDKFRVVATP